MILSASLGHSGTRGFQTGQHLLGIAPASLYSLPFRAQAYDIEVGLRG